MAEGRRGDRGDRGRGRGRGGFDNQGKHHFSRSIQKLHCQFYIAVQCVMVSGIC